MPIAKGKQLRLKRRNCRWSYFPLCFDIIILDCSRELTECQRFGFLIIAECFHSFLSICHSFIYGIHWGVHLLKYSRVLFIHFNLRKRCVHVSSRHILRLHIIQYRQPTGGSFLISDWIPHSFLFIQLVMITTVFVTRRDSTSQVVRIFIRYCAIG